MQSEITVVLPAAAGPQAPQQPQVNTEAMRELIKKKKIEAIQKLLKTSKFKELKKKKSKKQEDIQESCCICVEDFQENTEIKQTPCQHIFHNDCLF